MIYRAWMLAAALWAALCVALGFGRTSSGWGPWVIAFGPLALPPLLKLALGWVLYGVRYRPARCV
jgi:hypothetical protein